jgi:acyl-ACP thioesterase
MYEKQFSYPLKLGIAMFNGDGALKPDAYQALYMQAVEPHLMNIEMDEARIMRDFGVAWVLVSMAVEIRRSVRADDKLTARTWNTTEKTRLLFRRDVVVTDAQGETVFTVATFSALLDLNARRVCTDRELIAKFALPAGEKLMEASDRLRIKTPTDAPVEVLRVRPSWIDGVGHVNNFRYGEMAYDALTDRQRSAMGDLTRMELFFVSETHLGDEIALHRIEEGGSAIVTATVAGETRPAFTAKLTFREREAQAQ